MKLSTRLLALGAMCGLGLVACSPKGSTTSPDQAQAQADSSPTPAETPAQEEGFAPADQESAPQEAQPEAIAAPLPPSVNLKTGATCPNGAQAGESWKVDCNTCTCSEEGQMQCTLMACMAIEEPEKENRCPEGVKIGETWKDACNTCRCDEGGYPVCTLKACVDG